MTDSFHVERLAGKTKITLKVDHVYPEIAVHASERRNVQGELSFASTTEPTMLAEACTAARFFYPVHQVPTWFKIPGKVADMVAAEEIEILLAVDAAGAVCGMICWETPSNESASFFGPYTFSQDTTVPGKLMEAMLVKLGRSPAKIVFSNIATEDIAPYGFERLGKIEYHRPDGNGSNLLPVWFRPLREDFGASPRVHADLIPFLETQCDKHALMRDIRQTEDTGERISNASVFSTKLTRELSEASLQPLLNGIDNNHNLKRHVETLRKEGIKNIFFTIDLAFAWQGALGGDLLANDFVPQILLPHGGQSDVVIFQYVQPSA